MTVKELIAILEKLPCDMPVYIAEWNKGYNVPRELGSVEVATVDHKFNSETRAYIGVVKGVVLDVPGPMEHTA